MQAVTSISGVSSMALLDDARIVLVLAETASVYSEKFIHPMLIICLRNCGGYGSKISSKTRQRGGMLMRLWL